jgi:hypothetical protein
MSKPDRVPSVSLPNTDGHEQHQTAPTTQPVALRSSKIQDYHLNRLAVVYVRQSSPQQILDHRESRERQYALRDHAAALGWREERILVIDDDQGKSGRSAEQRAGFQRLLEEVNMGHVGLILALEMSRLAAVPGEAVSRWGATSLSRLTPALKYSGSAVQDWDRKLSFWLLLRPEVRRSCTGFPPTIIRGKRPLGLKLAIAWPYLVL